MSGADLREPDLRESGRTDAGDQGDRGDAGESGPGGGPLTHARI